jgi:pimeloyl-ACP methyl ester carboxylesterase
MACRRAIALGRLRQLAIVLLLSGCATPGKSAQTPASQDPEPLSEEHAPAQSRLADLTVAGHRPAVVSVPPGAKGPVLVVAHGAGDKAEEQCDWWRSWLAKRAFILCPRGIPMTRAPNTGWFFRDHHNLEREVLAGLDALHARFPRAARGPAVYAGYSQGGIMGALFAAKHPERFSRLILIEGGYAEWDVPTATRFREGGGKRVLFVCGQAQCARGARRCLDWFQRAGLSGRREVAAGAGHTYGGEVGARVRHAFDWVVSGDPRWAPAVP